MTTVHHTTVHNTLNIIFSPIDYHQQRSETIHK